MKQLKFLNSHCSIVCSNCSVVCLIAIVSQLSKCLKFVTFWGVILHRIRSFLSPRTDLNFRHLLNCDTIKSNQIFNFVQIK